MNSLEVKKMRDWLKEARTAKGYTMAALAKKLDISESYYCSIENGTRQVKMDMAIATGLSKELGVPLKRISDLEAQTTA
ncbi:helix-turn-helix transcriptional regulator [Clostridia bacterium OttesenSCG-928-O13]|nr:helix-turn-helix transcriptional regulator [Clostridia bacterium OttesenSCG-928-O13]